ncbi:RelA/SpoT family protein [Nannocystis radixulma]|uniref:HD domain-containing protein n=1 Tax=Nannocystis radixulma TaxID=2995305 RepID=A0ABT5B1Z7_9BACT|nr:HD domain-containing protein [Nannocystis radixulma]MDC0667559.1 HD domain-containing protein [Nannocystis radixulma]
MTDVACERPAEPSATTLLAELRDHGVGDTSQVEKAFALAERCHAGQVRKSGEPYLTHPLRVAETIARLGLDTSSVIAALLHDAVEDSDLSVFDLTEQFGGEIAGIVDGVTKLGKVPYLSRQEQQAESFRKMLLAMSQDIRVLLVKLADRLDNMRTLEHMPGDKRQRIARETMEIYAPLANRLGIQWIRTELQDLSFRYLEPAIYDGVQSKIDGLFAGAPEFVARGLAELQAAFLPPAGGNAPAPSDQPEDERVEWPEQLFGRASVRASVRRPYQVYRLSEEQDEGVDQVSDLVTFHIITRDRAGCYAALGVVHGRFTPVPGRFRDYIALPRQNHYQALHTAVMAHGVRLTLQIRSEGMDDVAEKGIVSEWRRDRAGSKGWQNLTWLKSLMDWQGEVSDPHEFIAAVKADLFADEVFVFTPQGDIHTFPRGATPIDFAFAIHTDLGNHCSAARINGHMVPLRYQLRQGDTIEIITTPNPAVRKEWLKMCQTSRAQARIKQYLRQQERGRLRALGRSLLDSELAGRGRKLAEFEAQGVMASRIAEIDLPKDLRSEDGLYEALGAGQVTPAVVADALAPVLDEDDNLFKRVLRRMSGKKPGPKLPGFGRLAPGQGAPGSPLLVTRERIEAGSSGAPMIQLAPCCSPLPGDPLIGYFVPGKGIAAHVEGCPEALGRIAERRLHLAWESGLEIDGPVTLEVRTTDTVGLLAEMSRAFSHHGINIKQANCRAYDSGRRAINTFQTTVRSLKQLSSLMATLRDITGVLAVERVFSRSE